LLVGRFEEFPLLANDLFFSAQWLFVIAIDGNYGATVRRPLLWLLEATNVAFWLLLVYGACYWTQMIIGV